MTTDIPAEPQHKSRYALAKELPFQGHLGLAINEIFVSFQGEGPGMGRPSTFLRLAGCNLTCTWCDTPDTWQKDKLRSIRTTIDKVYGDLIATPTSRLVVTGGEPMLQQRSLMALLAELRKHYQAAAAPYIVEVETNGTILPFRGVTQLVDRFNVSPKLPSSGNSKQVDPAILNQYLETRKAIFKFVVSETQDIFWIKSLTYNAGIPPRLVWLMPEGTSSEKVIAGLKRLAPIAAEHGWNLTPRMHVLIWEDLRGV